MYSSFYDNANQKMIISALILMPPLIISSTLMPLLIISYYKF